MIRAHKLQPQPSNIKRWQSYKNMKLEEYLYNCSGALTWTKRQGYDPPLLSSVLHCCNFPSFQAAIVWVSSCSSVKFDPWFPSWNYACYTTNEYTEICTVHSTIRVGYESEILKVGIEQSWQLQHWCTWAQINNTYLPMEETSKTEMPECTYFSSKYFI